MQTITICTDAGHRTFYKMGFPPSPQTAYATIAAWACYIRTPDKKINYSGMMKQEVKGSSQAELYAIANALYILAREYDLNKYHLIIYSDNLWALRNVQGCCSQESSKVYRQFIRPHVRKAGSYETRHVKGHLDPKDWDTRSARHYMQDWCDVEVHRIMKEAYKKINKK